MCLNKLIIPVLLSIFSHLVQHGSKEHGCHGNSDISSGEVIKIRRLGGGIGGSNARNVIEATNILDVAIC